jgi:multicomponent Na+:H+ antiporter subunit C
MIHNLLPYMMAFVIFAVGLYAIAVKKNLIKAIIGVIILEDAANLFLVLVGYRVPASGEPIPPIIIARTGAGRPAADLLRKAVDPLPQALVLASIVIGLAVVAHMVVLALRLHEKYGTFDLTEISKLKG